LGVALNNGINEDHFYGFMFNFHIMNNYYNLASGELLMGNTGCDSGCLDNLCTMEPTECLEIVYQYDCTNNGGNDDCWLCYDAMCMECSGYMKDECTTCHDFTTDLDAPNGECDCVPERDNKLARCFDCPGECKTCASDNSPFNDVIAYCEACFNGKYDISGSEDYAYCIDACPT